MLRRLVFVLSCAISWGGLQLQNAATAAEQFPYQAVVVGDQIETRCGPGAQFYVTGKIKANEQVTVHRHDHGGWYMISPPPGSFSWIEAELVKNLGNNRGQVTILPGSGHPPRAIVYIGSQLSDDHSFYGRELSNGDEVTILGEKTLTGKNGPTKMLKIAPPAQEFRWVKGEFLVPMSRQIQQQLAVDPYQVPAEHRQRFVMTTPIDMTSEPTAIAQALPEMKTASAAAVPEMKTAELVAPEPGPATVSTSPSAARKQQEFAKLEELDRKYAEMISRDPVEWDLEPICTAYEELQKNGNSHVSYLVSERMGEVQRRRDMARRYQKIVQVSTETAQRDAQLLAQRAEISTDRLEAPTAFQPEMVAGTTIVEGEFPAPEGQGFRMPVSAVSTPTGPAPIVTSTTPAAAPEGVSPQLNGAGILHRIQAPPGFPPYVLVAPDGRMLAYVEPAEGVSLEQWIGKPTGLIGRRNREESFNADVIRAQKVMPVQLAP